ncbi:MAG TPA: 3-hydroxyacyl-CoA dehydrogenase NAD-binding domain-containing protein [Actinomycetota bacterium]|nr:3-hydroxyacyl-CoA dehydrogenase NAD-binding domain-containing protein [Actinomycetota bacterium]
MKEAVFRELDASVKPDAILASTTSSPRRGRPPAATT